MDIQQRDQLATLQTAFLAAFKEYGHDGAAAAIAGVAYSEVDKWKEDENFMIQYNDAQQYFSGTLVKEAVIRARDGWEEPIIHQGEIQYEKDPDTGQLLLDDELKPIPATIRKKSDSLLRMALKANIEEYNPQSKVELTGADGQPVSNNITVEFIQSTGVEDGEAKVPALEQALDTSLAFVGQDDPQKLEGENHG